MLTDGGGTLLTASKPRDVPVCYFLMHAVVRLQSAPRGERHAQQQSVKTVNPLVFKPSR